MKIADKLIYVKSQELEGDVFPVRIIDIAEIYYLENYGAWEIFLRDGSRILEKSSYRINLNRLKKVPDLFCTDYGLVNIRNIDLKRTFKTWGKYDIDFGFRPGYLWGVTVSGGGRYISLEPETFRKLREKVNEQLETSYGESPYADNGLIQINSGNVVSMTDILFVEPEREEYARNYHVVFRDKSGITVYPEEMSRIANKKYMIHVTDESVMVPENNRHVDSDLWINVTNVDTRETMKEYQFHDNDFLRRCPICFLTMKNGDRNLAIRITGKMARKLDQESRERNNGQIL
jgi:hypothetical protein